MKILKVDKEKYKVDVRLDLKEIQVIKECLFVRQFANRLGAQFDYLIGEINKLIDTAK